MHVTKKKDFFFSTFQKHISPTGLSSKLALNTARLFILYLKVRVSQLRPYLAMPLEQFIHSDLVVSNRGREKEEKKHFFAHAHFFIRIIL